MAHTALQATLDQNMVLLLAIALLGALGVLLIVVLLALATAAGRLGRASAVAGIERSADAANAEGLPWIDGRATLSPREVDPWAESGRRLNAPSVVSA